MPDGEEQLTRKQKEENRIVDRVVARIQETFAEKQESLPEDFDKFVAFMESARVIAASAILAALFGSVYEYLSLMGVADVSPARVVLCCAWFFGVMFAWEIITLLFRLRRRAKALLLLVSALAFAVGFYVLDHWARAWQRAHPPEVARLSSEVHELGISVQQLSTVKSEAKGIEDNLVEVRELKPVPGFLRPDQRYPRLPLIQENLAAIIHVLFVNGGSSYVHKGTMKDALYYINFHGTVPPLHDEQIKDTVLDAVEKLPDGGTNDIAPGAGMWNTLQTDQLTKGMVSDLDAGTARLYLVAYSEWVANNKEDSVEVCLWLQPLSWNALPQMAPPDPKKSPPVWHTC